MKWTPAWPDIIHEYEDVFESRSQPLCIVRMRNYVPTQIPEMKDVLQTYIYTGHFHSKSHKSLHLAQHFTARFFKPIFQEHNSLSLSSPNMKLSILASLMATSQALALALPTPDTNSTSLIIPRIIGNEASVLLCVQPNSKKCGIFATYTNTATRQSVKYETGGQTYCAYQFLQKHTNSAGFWVDLDIFGSSKGANIGYNPTGRKITLGKATSSSSSQSYLDGRCGNEFGWRGVDTGSSGESFFGDLGTKLY